MQEAEAFPCQWSESLAEVVSVVFCEQEDPPDSEEGLEIVPFEQDGDRKPQINQELNSEQCEQIEQLCEEFADVFNPYTTLVEHSLPTGNAKPVSHHPRRVPLAWVEKVRGEIDAMLEAGVIEPSTSPNSPSKEERWGN